MDHPAFTDAAYRRRRDAIAALARDPSGLCRVDYTEEEEGVWRRVWEVLRPLHEQLACREVLELQDQLLLHERPIPQLVELTDTLEAASGIRLVSVSGLENTREFFNILRDRAFPSTQYIRHPSTPLYTPEPDLIHEFVGHVASLMHPRVAELCVAFGEASEHADLATENRLERVFWFSLEYGMIRQDGGLKCFGAGLLSSCGEIAQAATDPVHREWDIEAMAAKDYDPTHLQPELFVASSFDHMLDSLFGWLKGV
jgi:phenylalanine-4-hydroxylase